MTAAESGSLNGISSKDVLRRRLTLFGLFLVGVMSYVDRTIVSVLQVPIKQELGLSDTQLGTLTGISFALVYTSMAIPIARLADRTNRKYVILASLAIWSAMTAFSGFATSFLMLVLLRTGVGFGEAGSVPATHSTIADLYPREQRARAVAAWGLSLPAGMIVGLIAAGQIAENLGWRTAFWLIGGLGIALIPLLFFLMREPARGRFDPVSARAVATPPMRESLSTLWRLKTFRLMVIGGSLHAFVQYSLMNWNAPFYTRVHGMSLSDTANALALLSGLGGAIGIWSGGWLADRLGSRDVRWQLRVPALAMAAMVPLAAIQYVTTSASVSIAVGLVSSTLLVFYFAPIVAVPMLVVHSRLRAFASSVVLVVFNLVGLGLGPTVTGVISDYFINNYGMAEESLRYSLVIVLLPSLFAAFLFWRASQHLPLEALDRASSSLPKGDHE